MSNAPQDAVLAQIIMAEKETQKKGKKSTIRKAFDPDADSESRGKALFTPDELDIYCNKVTLETYIFHGKKLDHDSLDRLEYDSKAFTVDVVKKDGTKMDLGVKIQWLVRPYFSKAKEVSIIQTKDGEAISGTMIPIVHKGDKKAK